MFNIKELLYNMAERGASDLHITANLKPHLRIDERLYPLGEEVLTPEDSKRLIFGLLSDERKEEFEREKELDFAFTIEGLARFRVNVFLEKQNWASAIRALPFKIMSFKELGLPIKVAEEFCRLPKGLILVTGATGSGKSTTLASMVDKINTERDEHIITIEDPIEYLHFSKKSIIHQREVGSDTHSFPVALKHVLREDPDVILIGEMRDLETIESALIIAETGHLVFATLHTSDAVQTINRIIDVFPSRQQAQVRTQLSFVLMGIFSQQLIPRASGKGRVLAVEVLVANHAIRSMVREMKTHQLYSVIQTGQREGMQTMNQSLFELCQGSKITYEDAISRTTEVGDLERMFRDAH